ncbi:MAG: SDR family oxidoreductase [Bacteroidia bacterium]|jgi:NAD(P)-dependent dehydrogenase (short-subunit alcohol dehydrogenase family)|nr:SDR family oxidoreductase [Bacteroidia bacterium]
MKNTVLITGTSSGIGRETVKYFSNRGWNVAATMRTPSKETELGKLPNVKLYALDVTDENSIAQAIQNAITDFGSIDVIVNNAGYGAIGIFEAASAQQIQRQFDTNVFGVMNVTRAILPHFRAKKKGTIVNVTSMGGLITFPIYSVYHGTKWAVEGWAEALAYELRPFNIKVKNVEPGAIKTDFYDRSQDMFSKEGLTAYDSYQAVTFKNSQAAGANAPGPEVVAKTIFKAAGSTSNKLRYPAGMQAKSILVLRRTVPLGWFRAIVRSIVEKGFKG